MPTYEAGAWKSLQLKNFRRFEDTGPITFAPVTLYFGKNSSGKTSLLRSPLLLKQMVQARGIEVPLVGAEVDLGSYRELVHQGQLRRNVEISFEVGQMLGAPTWGQPRMLQRLHPDYGDFIESMRVHVELHWNVRNSRTQMDKLVLASSSSGAEIKMTRRGPAELLLEFPAQAKRFVVDNPLTFSALRFLDLSTSAASGRQDQPSPELNALDYLTFMAVNSIQSAAAGLIHIGPLRDVPDRAYRTDQAGQAGSAGSIVEVLAGERQAQKRVSQALQLIGMARDVTLKTLAPGYVGIVLTDSTTGRLDNLADVGFGVSQVLPILVTLATAPRGATVLIEQPELHLHPDAQGQLADVLFQLSRERNLTLVLETHSEHILLRAQRRIAEGQLAADDVAPYFVDAGQVRRAAIDDLGRLDSEAMPGGFFEEEWVDAVKLAQAAARKRSR